MPKPPALTSTQRRRLAILEPRLRIAAKFGRYDDAKLICAEIQDILRPTGHETRLLQAKNWVYEAALEDDKLEIAVLGFSGTRKKAARQTRVHLEATALLAVCFLRQREYEKAEPLMAEALEREANIVSAAKRFQFRRRLISRFEQETLLFALRGNALLPIDIDEVQRNAELYIMSKTDDEILAAIGAAVPPTAVAALLRVHDFATKELQKYSSVALPPAQQFASNVSLGGKVVEAAKRVAWRALCDKDSEIYRAWFTKGIAHVMDGRLMASAVVASLGGFRLGTYTLVVSVTAIVCKMGLETFCEVSRPQSLMIERTDASH